MAPSAPFPAPGENPWGEGLRSWADGIEEGVLVPTEDEGIFQIGRTS